MSQPYKMPSPSDYYRLPASDQKIIRTYFELAKGLNSWFKIQTTIEKWETIKAEIVDLDFTGEVLLVYVRDENSIGYELPISDIKNIDIIENFYS